MPELDLLIVIIAGISALVGFAIGIPLVLQFVGQVSQRMHASNLQSQINDNTAINNTAVSGTAGTEEVAKTAKE